MAIEVKGLLCLGLPWWHSGLESACQCKGHRFDPWPGKIPHAMEQPTRHGTTKPVRHNYWACALEPMCHNHWSPHAKSSCSATREATTMRSPHTTTKSSPRSPQLEKARTQQQRPNTAKNKNKQINKFILKKKDYSVSSVSKYIHIQI